MTQRSQLARRALLVAVLVAMTACAGDARRSASPSGDSGTDTATDADDATHDAQPAADVADDRTDDPDTASRADTDDDPDAAEVSDPTTDENTTDDSGSVADAPVEDVADIGGGDGTADPGDDVDDAEVADVPTDVAPDGSGDVAPDVDEPPAPTCGEVSVITGDAAPLALTWRDRATEAGLAGIQSELVPTLGGSPCGEEAVFTGGAAVADYDDDGDLDVFLPRSLLPDQLFRNDGSGAFEDVAPALGIDSVASGNAAAWVDVDADGDLDLFVSNNAAEPHHMWVRRDDDTWVDEAEERGVALGDEANRPAGCGHFTGATFADADGDGDLDLTLARWVTRDRTWRLNLLLNDGTGHFRDGTVESGLVAPARSVVFGSSWFDFDGDGDRDALLTADFGTSRYFERRDGTLVEATATSGLGTDENGMGAAVGDADGDGDLDVFVTSIYGETAVECGFSWGCTGNRLYLNDGAGRFADCTDLLGVRDGGWGWGTAWFDADLDGDLDLAQTGGYWPHWADERLDRFREAAMRYRDGGMRLWQAGPTRPWSEVSGAQGFVNERRGRALVPFDADGDGDIDVLVVNNGDAPALLENTGAEHRRWLRVRLRGAAPNTFGIGAVVLVRATSDGPWLRRDLATGDTYIGSLPPEAHFGLGDHDGPVDTVRVRWPSGRVTEVRDAASGAILVVDE